MRLQIDTARPPMRRHQLVSRTIYNVFPLRVSKSADFSSFSCHWQIFMNLTEARIAIIGLGYVGLPLAVEFGKLRPVLGFDTHTVPHLHLPGLIGYLQAVNGDRIVSLADARASV